MTKVSVIIPTYNRLSQLKQAITGLEKQTYPFDEFEVIVVSDGSADGTTEYLQTIASPLQLQPVLQENQGPAAARNHGVSVATGELVLFMDDDIVPVPMFVAEHVASYEKHGPTTSVLGPMLTPTDFQMAPWVFWEQQMLYKQYSDMNSGRWEPTARQFYTGNASVARHLILAAGGFDESVNRAEDVDLAYRMVDQGVKFIFNPSAIGYHYAHRAFTSWMRTPYLYGRYDVVFARDKGQSWLLEDVAWEFHRRHRLVQMLARFCISRKMLYAIVIGTMQRIASLSTSLQMPQISQYAYSGIFNLCHYQGIADELGDRQQFLQLMRSPR
ncbi:MAG: glycosyltransferase family 2 protein [Caldilineaceae bacterium]